MWFRLHSNRALHDFLAMDCYPYNRKIMKACGLTSLPDDRRTFDRRLARKMTIIILAIIPTALYQICLLILQQHYQLNCNSMNDSLSNIEKKINHRMDGGEKWIATNNGKKWIEKCL